MLNIPACQGNECISAYVKPVENFLNRLYRRSKRKDGKDKFTRLHKALTWPRLLVYAALRVLGNKGAYTAGVDKVTKGIFLRTFKAQIAAIREEIKKYSPREVLRKYVPKPNGDKRPLGIPVLRDRVIQEAVRMILEAIYEPVFMDNSWGFRVGRSTQDCVRECFTALQYPKKMQYVLEFDIRKFYDNVDHTIMYKLLTKKIHDRRLKLTIWRMMKSPIHDNGVILPCDKGVPQGGVVSPTLANIYLHEFDVFMDELREQYTCVRAVQEIRKDGTTCHKLKAQRTPNGGTIIYIRYADDGVAFYNGHKSEIFRTKERCKKFLKERLNLELSEEKTSITDVEKGFNFVGFHFRRKTTANSCCSPGRKVKHGVIDVPIKSIKKACDSITKRLKEATCKGYEPIYAILKTNEILNAFYHYYRNISFRSARFNKVYWHAKKQFRFYLKRRGIKRSYRYLRKMEGCKTYTFFNKEKVYYLRPPIRMLKTTYKEEARLCNAQGMPLKDTSRFMQREVKANVTRLYPNDPIVPINADWRALRLERLRLDGGKCVYCGKPATEVDHVFTKTQAKCDRRIRQIRNKIKYLRSMCRHCHLKRHGKRWSWDFVMEYIEGFLKAFP